ncbi:cytochrome P450 [Obba rivulosa]|uniref:Cytochrome P450 n=1 Tax=Obba rivulosa TaxID=1052685 RepID=A0A8E2B540_9APHY|nr:cytochrome P450 [Obba rivulosa]
MLFTDALVLLSLLIMVFCIARYRQHTNASKGFPLPPGPPGNIISGNIRALAQDEAHRTFARYRKEYGDLVMLQGLGSKILVLNSLEAMNELFDKRANNYSTRPNFVFAGELMGLNQTVTMMPYGQEWRALRKLAHTALSPAQVKKYHGMEEDVAALLCTHLLESPERFSDHVRTSAGSLMIAITYGIPASPMQTSYIIDGERAADFFTRAIDPGRYLCDFLPFLKYAPSWVSFQRQAREGRELLFGVRGVRRRPLEQVKHEMEAGTAPPSLVHTALLSPPNDVSISQFEWRVMMVAGDIFGAGSDTTHATLLAFIMAMALHRDKQLKAQAEIDAIIGNSRLPIIQDRVDLPYVNALLKETMRWQPVTPTGLPRCSVDDDFYGGYYIPKNTTVLPNVWAIAYEPNEKYNPESFLPERFLDETQNIPDPITWAFGFGRRICPGRYLAEDIIFILMASILAVFDIFPPDDGGITQEFKRGLVRAPNPFQCRIVPRPSADLKFVQARAEQSRTQ